jgi:hypothetical protein
MRDVDSVGVTFVNVMLGQGTLNGVVNLSLGVLQWTPNEKDNTVDPDLRVAARLRMDLVCAKQLHDSLGKLLDSIEQEKAQGASDTPMNGVAQVAANDKPN